MVDLSFRDEPCGFLCGNGKHHSITDHGVGVPSSIRQDTHGTRPTGSSSTFSAPDSSGRVYRCDEPLRAHMFLQVTTK
eukprot:8810576-Pyramimonas_sp.AAC.1